MSQWLNDLYEHAVATTVVLGGAAAVATGVSGFLSKCIADRSIEKHKAALNRELERLKAILAREADSFRLDLKKQELIFDKELDATSAFMKLHRKITPSYSHPDMDWSEACEDVVSRFTSHEETLGRYLDDHGALWPHLLRNKIRDCREIASIYKFEGHGPDADPSREALTKAGEFLDALEAIENEMIKAVRTWEGPTQSPRDGAAEDQKT